MPSTAELRIMTAARAVAMPAMPTLASVEKEGEDRSCAFSRAFVYERGRLGKLGGGRRQDKTKIHLGLE